MSIGFRIVGHKLPKSIIHETCGDAYTRSDGAAIKMGRRQLQSLFEKKFRDSLSDTNIDIGFPGEIIHKKLTLPCCDLSQLPSAVAAGKLEQLVKVHSDSRNSGSMTVMARLVHARLFGSPATGMLRLNFRD